MLPDASWEILVLPTGFDHMKTPKLIGRLALVSPHRAITPRRGLDTKYGVSIAVTLRSGSTGTRAWTRDDVDDTDLEMLRKLLDDYANASREVIDRFRSAEDRLAALHRRRRLGDEILERFPPPS